MYTFMKEREREREREKERERERLYFTLIMYTLIRKLHAVYAEMLQSHFDKPMASQGRETKQTFPHEYQNTIEVTGA